MQKMISVTPASLLVLVGAELFNERIRELAARRETRRDVLLRKALSNGQEEIV